MGDEQHGAVEGVDRLLQLLDGGQVQVIGRLVEDEEIDPARLKQREGRPSAFPGGQRSGRSGDVVGAEAELGQQGAHLRVRPVRHLLLEGSSQGGLGLEGRAGLVDLTDDDGRPQAGGAARGCQPAQEQRQQGGLAGAIGTRDRHAIAEVELEVDRPQLEGAACGGRTTGDRHDVAGAAGGGDGELEVPLLAWLLDDREPLDHLLGLLGLCRLLLGCRLRVMTDELVALLLGLPLAQGIARALVHPRPLSSGPLLEPGLARGVVLVGLTRLTSGDGAFLQIGVVGAAVNGDALQGSVDLDDRSDCPREELAIMTDQHKGCVEGEHEVLQCVEPGQVEVVGRFVEQVGVVARHEQPGQRDPRRLPAGEGPNFTVEVDPQPEVGRHNVESLLDIRAAEGQPCVERHGIRLVGGGVTGGELLGGGLHPRGGVGNPGAAQDLPADRLSRSRLGLLGEEAEVGIAR